MLESVYMSKVLVLDLTRFKFSGNDPLSSDRKSFNDLLKFFVLV